MALNRVPLELISVGTKCYLHERSAFLFFMGFAFGFDAFCGVGRLCGHSFCHDLFYRKAVRPGENKAKAGKGFASKFRGSFKPKLNYAIAFRTSKQ